MDLLGCGFNFSERIEALISLICFLVNFIFGLNRQRYKLTAIWEKIGIVSTKNL